MVVSQVAGRRRENVFIRQLKRGAVAIGLVALLSPLAAQAFDADQWNPAVDPQGYFSIYSSKTSPRGRFYISAWYSYAKNTLNVQPSADNLSQLQGLLGPLHVA